MAYSDVEKAEAIIRLAVNKYDLDKTAEQTGVSRASLKRWLKSEPKKGVPDLLERAIERLLMVIPVDMRANDWAIALGILLDKWLLLQGQPTERTESLFKQIERMRDNELDDVLAEAERILTTTGGGDTQGDH